MAEILLSLTIIGVVAAITLPSLTGNINERTWNTQRKALYARMSQAISLMPALNGYGTLSQDDEGNITDNAAETFLTEGLSKVLKINNICDNEHLADCGIVTSFTNDAGSQISLPTTLYELNPWFASIAFSGYSYSTRDTKAAAFETQNGESIVAYYNQSCQSGFLNRKAAGPNNIQLFAFPQPNMCVNLIYDLNGTKGPNTLGKDIGIITIFHATDSFIVAPIPSSANNTGSATYYNASKLCTNTDSETRLPNIDELSAMLINKNIVNLTDSAIFWSSTVESSETAWNVYTNYGVRYSDRKTINRTIKCIKR